MLRDNLLGILSLLTVFRELSVNGVIVVVSSSAVYGEHPTHRLPLVEDDLLAPLVTYGVSKLAVEALALQHFRAYGIRIIIVRPFNVTGPGEPAWFVTSAFAQQIALIESGRRDPLLKVGDLETVRDFTDVRDAAEALTELAEAGEPGQVYNLCSGVGVPVDQVLSLLMQESGLNVSVSQDPGRLRPVEIRTQIGSPAKMLRTISWRPRYCLRRTLRDVLDYWRFRVHENNSGVPGSKC
jgi:GDP-4-dehydro-6-deoxy-D-mannose reductase